VDPECPNGCEIIRRTNSAPALATATLMIRRRSGLMNVRFQLTDEEGEGEAKAYEGVEVDVATPGSNGTAA